MMIRLRILQRLRKRWFASRKHRIAGFTLIEILVSLLIGAIITAALLSLVVDLTDANLKDTSRSETQRDMQQALNYITQDLREAVYVYDGTCLITGNGNPSATNYATTCPGLANFIAPQVTQAPNIPVLAFWRPDPLPPAVQAQCVAAANTPIDPTTQQNLALQALVGPPGGADGVPCPSGKSYTLVVYGITKRSPTDIWQGRARITRYRLSQFRQDGTRNVGWANPQYDDNSGFQQWPYRSDATLAPGYAQATNSFDLDVLVDFVDDTQANALAANQQPTCAAPSVMSPLPATNPFVSFFACVRGNNLDTTANTVNEQGINQEVQLVLQGNVSGRSGFPIQNFINQTRLSPLQTRVLVRGIINKKPT